MSDILQEKVSSILEKFYGKDTEEKELTILSEDEDKPKKKKLNSYQKCFLEKLKETGKTIPEMDDDEKVSFFKTVKEKCKKNK